MTQIPSPAPTTTPASARVYPPEEKRVPGSYKEFVALYKGFVKERVWRYNRGQVTAEEMADVEQSVWARFIEYDVLAKYTTSRGTFPGFLSTLVYNASWNLRRARKKRERERVLKSGPEDAPDDPRFFFEEVFMTDEGSSAEESSRKAEFRKLDGKLAVHLSESERHALYTKAMTEGIPLEDILLRTGLDPDAIEYIFEEVLLRASAVWLPLVKIPR